MKFRRLIAGIACAAMALTIVPLAAGTASAAEPVDNGKVTTYAATPGDKISTKYQVTVNGTKVDPAVYDANKNNFDIARFESTSRTPVVTVTVPDTVIDTVNIYPTRYYEGKYTVSPDKHTLTFQMEGSLNYVFVMINGDATLASGQPYLALINDPVEKANGYQNGKVDAATGINESTGVLNLKTFGENWFKTHKNSEAQTENLQKNVLSHFAGQELAGGKVTVPADQKISAGKIVPQGTNAVRYPNERALADDDYTYVLQEALKTIKDNDKLDTLYIPSGSYTWAGLDINGWKGKNLTVYTEPGALMTNHIQPYSEALEPAIGVWNSENVTISGRGIYDGNGVRNYNQWAGGDWHDAWDTMHQAGVMIVHSSNITFNDTYQRNAKQWNWETHTAKHVRMNNIKGLTPYGQPWVDGTDLASGQDVQIDGVLTLGNDDAFASGHYMTGDLYAGGTSADNITNMGLNNARTGATFDLFNADPSKRNYQAWVNSAAGAEREEARHQMYDTETHKYTYWDNDDTTGIVVKNTLNWSYAGGNGLRLGFNADGHTLGDYTFENFNPISFQGGGWGIDMMNQYLWKDSSTTYGKYKNITIRNSSFDTSRVGGNFRLVGGAQSQGDPLIDNVTLDDVWFSNADAQSQLGNIRNATINNLHIGGKLVKFTNQNELTTSGKAGDWDAPTNLAYTYTNADGKSVAVRQNTPPTFTAPEAGSYTAKAGEQLAFDVKATDPDEGDTVTLASKTLPVGAKFDAATGKFTWTPTDEQSGKTYTVMFTAADEGVKDGAYAATTKSVRIRVGDVATSLPTEGTIADFTFDKLANGATGTLKGDSSNAVATINGKAATGTGLDGTTAAKVNKDFWLNLTKADGTSLLKGAKELTVSFDAKADNGVPGWAFYAARDDSAPVANQEHYLGTMVKPNSVNIERYNGADGATQRDTTASTGANDLGSTGGWYNVTLTVSDQATSLYVDGKLVGEAKGFNADKFSLPAILGENGGILQIGKANWGNGEYYSGLLDNLKIYDRVLGAADIAKAFDSTAPTLSGVDDATIDLGASFDPKAGVTATDDIDGDLTSAIAVDGTVDTSKAGAYTLTYAVSDKAGNTATANRTVTVKAKDVEPEPTPATDEEFAALGEAITAAKALQEKDYKSGWDAFQSALDAAEKVFENKASTSDQVNGALTALRAAVAGLKSNGNGGGNTGDNGGNGGNAGAGTGSAVKPGSAKPQQKPAGGLSNTGADVAVVFAIMAVLVLAAGATLALKRRA